MVTAPFNRLRAAGKVWLSYGLGLLRQLGSIHTNNNNWRRNGPEQNKLSSENWGGVGEPSGEYEKVRTTEGHEDYVKSDDAEVFTPITPLFRLGITAIYHRI